MTKYKKYLWLISQLQMRGRMTFGELQDAWEYALCNDQQGSRLPRSTFVDMKRGAEELFELEIRCDRRTNEYYLDDASLLPPRQNTGHLRPFHIPLRHADGLQGSTCQLQEICIHTTPEMGEELREYPLHESQRECPTQGEYCEFRYLLAPDLDFYGAICSFGSMLEVVSPQWLRHHLTQDAELLFRTYMHSRSTRSEQMRTRDAVVTQDEWEGIRKEEIQTLDLPAIGDTPEGAVEAVHVYVHEVCLGRHLLVRVTKAETLKDGTLRYTLGEVLEEHRPDVVAWYPDWK